MENIFEEKYSKEIIGNNSTFDRVIISGSIKPISYKEGLNTYLSAHHILLKDFTSYANKLSIQLKEQARLLSEKESVEYIYLNNSRIRKEELIRKKILKRGEHPGLVAILSCLELDNSFDIYRNKWTQKLELVSRKRKCLHIYYYFIDKKLGLCFFRIQTFFPFKVTIYFNGKEKLAREMSDANIDYQKEDNCFTWIDDLIKSQELSDDYDVPKLQSIFDRLAEKYVPILKELSEKWNLSYHWSIRQIEYAKDIMFKNQSKLDVIYEQLIKYSVLTASPEDVLSFLGKKQKGQQGGKVETSRKKTYLGYRVKHKNGSTSIKIYNKAGSLLRIEVTFNNISELKVIREVHQKNGEVVKKLTNMKRSIYSIEHIIRFAKAAINRYTDFLSKMDNNDRGFKELRQLTERKTENGNNYKGFNPLHKDDFLLFQELLNGGFIANGVTNKTFRVAISKSADKLNWNSSKVGRYFKRLRVFGLLRKVNNSYKYFLTEKGRMILILSVKLRNLTAIPELNKLVCYC
ncbi:MAG: hypothetical protein KKG93_16330 [Bacteroidetes bacterium]|nr:hypothetical protein [Bacteroidota bacterium]